MSTTLSRLLARISSPDDLRALAPEQLPALAAEIRSFLVRKVTASGGHLGSNLGVVELTIALHRVFRSPGDTILFDTGHQAYVHKLLTGRRAGFDKLRKRGGLSGYPEPAESPHDVIGNSHASTALSYADGLAKARQLAGDREHAVVAVVGDGSLTGGMAWEALNNLGTAKDRPVIVVLNDNGRSYAPTHGAIADHLAALRGDRLSVTVFENLGFRYLGPVHGHDLAALESALRTARQLRGPVVVHCITRKGAGYRPAEQDLEDHLHAVPAAGARSLTRVFSEELCALGEQLPDLVCVTAAMPGPTGLSAFGARYPGRMFDVGIAEQHAVASAAGLALGGLRPLVAIYASFLNRAFDQLLLDVALRELPVTIVLDRAGVTGPDGPSHHGMWDLAMLSAVPGLSVAAPRDAVRLRELLRECLSLPGPSVLRFPKGPAGAELAALERSAGLDILWLSGRDVLLVGVGAMAAACVDAAERLTSAGIGVTVADPRWALPVTPGLAELAAEHDLVVTVEDGVVSGGVGAAVIQACAPGARVRTLGLPRTFVEHGTREELLASAGLTGPAIARAVRLEHQV
ncbi:1-deoxy-D-xylulose-5-phosphate synthase [Nonomuraea soli]|uniref:1-deoxy-D-xylulose-5-phosphate synthase n=1 Tax=Nonomuraea soli TaxID=1032476 RepID=A0A7W0CE82_9ACTN|nr:1-deoxy-D-xylulose-5-phosphate synthase [Nonomuraea soli]MBA2889504.1 1-deoxy-D-xylulose-5-phosphate synthase [Nonomuraea soli]